jgi:hypothetical protein
MPIPASPDRVWQLIGGFNSLPDWLPYIPSSELSEGGRVRRLANPAGDAIVERLESFDNDGRSYSYSILEAPFPISAYRSTLQVKSSALPDSALVEWSGVFTANGGSDEDAVALFHGIYEDGLKALRNAFTDGTQALAAHDNQPGNGIARRSTGRHCKRRLPAVFAVHRQHACGSCLPPSARNAATWKTFFRSLESARRSCAAIVAH